MTASPRLPNWPAIAAAVLDLASACGLDLRHAAEGWLRLNDHPERRPAYRRALEAFVSELRRRGVRVVVDTDAGTVRLVAD